MGKLRAKEKDLHKRQAWTLTRWTLSSFGCVSVQRPLGCSRQGMCLEHKGNKWTASGWWLGEWALESEKWVQILGLLLPSCVTLDSHLLWRTQLSHRAVGRIKWDFACEMLSTEPGTSQRMHSVNASAHRPCHRGLPTQAQGWLKK